VNNFCPWHQQTWGYVQRILTQKATHKKPRPENFVTLNKIQRIQQIPYICTNCYLAKPASGFSEVSIPLHVPAERMSRCLQQLMSFHNFLVSNFRPAEINRSKKISCRPVGMAQNAHMVTNPAVESSSQLLIFFFLVQKSLSGQQTVSWREMQGTQCISLKLQRKLQKKQVFEGDCCVRSYCTKTSVSMVITLTFTKSDCQAYHEWNGSD
jgi:hypothetical protein